MAEAGDAHAPAQDTDEHAARAALRRAKRVIIKIGSKSLSGDAWDRLAHEVLALRSGAHGGGRRGSSAGRSVILVTSGAIALGVTKLGFKSRPKDMARLQAAAAAGQSVLMQRYEEAFGKVGLVVAQVLLTHADLADRTRTNNAREALAALLDAGAVPIINENDAVATEEIRFGDNDQLSAMVAPLVDADLLVLLSDVEGLLDVSGHRVPFVRSVAREARHLAGQSTSGVGTGGMASKVEAARRATLAGAHVVIAAARDPEVVARVIAGEDVGTLFAAVPQRIGARKHWIAYTLRPRGALLVDRGAVEAITASNRSILAVGVLGVRGTFVPGDAVAILDPDGAEIARGLARFSASDAARIARKKRPDIDDDILVHRDDLVVLPSE
ncbi:glutamate 5-kinase [Chondromyces apiculatus]|uniref:Glutamate 5-kinase n=1 Tax=Chondromyces apiculatus DSM 436 TaxID=1192034 RepID=A0A017T4C1_9BACT|nr:glutamate 5-kinase [Chondromyces apiculatus]EYF04054.1 Glutamate 5-kinase [Chondromyces apiculatus DSM 436]